MQTADEDRDGHAISLEQYRLMSEKEKDAEIENAIIRLQKRIQQILYFVESENTRLILQARPDEDKQRDEKTG